MTSVVDVAVVVVVVVVIVYVVVGGVRLRCCPIHEKDRSSPEGIEPGSAACGAKTLPQRYATFF